MCWKRNWVAGGVRKLGWSTMFLERVIDYPWLKPCVTRKFVNWTRYLPGFQMCASDPRRFRSLYFLKGPTRQILPCGHSSAS